MKYCPSCGAAAENAAVFCMSCGEAFPQVDTGKPLDYHKNSASIKKKKWRPTIGAPRPAETAPELLPEEAQVEEHARTESPYDGYYDDIQPVDDGALPDRISSSMAKQIAILLGSALFIIAVAIILMRLL